MNIYITKIDKEHYSILINKYTVKSIRNRNRLLPEQFNRIYGDICCLMYDTYEKLFNIQLEYPINEYRKLAENHNCTIIEQTIKRRTLRLPVFTSLEDAEAKKAEK